MKCALLAAALLAPTAMLAQGRADAREQVVVTTTTVRIRTAPSIISLSTDEYGAGTQFRLAPEDYQSKDWFAIEYDGRVLYVPRYAAVMKSRAGMHVAAPAVMQAGEPTAAPAAVMAAAPATVSAAPMRAPQRAAPQVAARQPAPEPASPVAQARQAPTAAPAAVERVAGAHAAKPDAAPATPTVHPSAVAAAPTPERKPEPPAMRAQHGSVGGTLGFLGSVTPIKVAGLAPAAHIAGASFINLKYRGWGIYGAPEIGQGGGYKSTLWGGGLSRDLLDLHLLHATVLGGYAQYSETPDGVTPSTTQTMSGYSVGGLVSLPIAGPLRLGYRGQYVTATVAGTQVHMTRHSFGFLF